MKQYKLNHEFPREFRHHNIIMYSDVKWIFIVRFVKINIQLFK